MRNIRSRRADELRVEGDRRRSPWAYTVGLTAHGKPELVVTGFAGTGHGRWGSAADAAVSRSWGRAFRVSLLGTERS